MLIENFIDEKIRSLQRLTPQCAVCRDRRVQVDFTPNHHSGGPVAEWLACWTRAQNARVQIAAATLSGNSLRQTVRTHRASVHQTAKLVAAL